MFCMCLRCIIRNNQKRQAKEKQPTSFWSRNIGILRKIIMYSKYATKSNVTTYACSSQQHLFSV